MTPSYLYLYRSFKAFAKVENLWIFKLAADFNLIKISSNLGSNFVISHQN